MSLAVADVDGDGFLDWYVTNYRTSALMDIPNARATFKEVEGRTVIETFNGRPMTDPDLADRFSIGPRGAIEENGEPDVLYLNRGGTNFVAATFTRGQFLDEAGRPLARPLFEWGLMAAFRDINRDGRPDLYVCNDFQSPDRFWINQGGGRFRLVPPLALRKTSLFAMAADFADIDRDGHDDFLVLDMLSRDHAQRMRYVGDKNPSQPVVGQFDDRPQYGLNTLFLNRGDGTFAELAQLSGLHAAEWSWSCIFLDVDLDGWEDVLVVNGMERAARDMDVVDRLKQLRATRQPTDAEIFQARRMFPRLGTANLAFRNRGNLTFEEVGAAWGFDARGVSQAMALADLDNDGDLDVVVNNLNAPVGLYRNDSPAPRLAVRLKGLPPNTRGVGARITVRGGPVPAQSQEMIAGGRYLSSDDPVRSFAAGATTARLDLEVIWPSGRRSVLTNLPPNWLYEVDETHARDPSPSSAPSETKTVESSAARLAAGSPSTDDPNGWTAGSPATATGSSRHPERAGEAGAGVLFADVSARLGHRHHEVDFDDFARQPLLPNKLSQLGPGLAWFDWDGDGWDDLVVGSGKGGRLSVFRNDGQGGFAPLTGTPFDAPVTRDQTGVVVAQEADGQPVVLTGLSNYEDGLALGCAVRQYRAGELQVDDRLPATASSPGPLALADWDGDGDLDLFVGGRVVPGKYPSAANSALFRNQAGAWVPDALDSKALAGAGLVSGAVFTDLDGDGDPDLVLACEWGPLRLFRNDQARLSPWDPEVRLGSAPPESMSAGGTAGASIGGGSAPSIPRPAWRTLRTLSALTGWWTGVTSGDFDGDGRLDLVAANWGRNTKYEEYRDHALELYHGDFDGDGTWDLIEAHHDVVLQATVPERQLDVMAQALPFLRGTFASHRAYSVAGVSDLLGERRATAALLQAVWLESTVFLNRGDHFEVRPLPLEAQFAPAFAVCVADADGDGSEDIFLSQNFFGAQLETPRYDAGRGLWLLGDGHGEFRPVAGSASGVLIYGEQRGAAVCDFDRDGRVDLAVAQNGAATVLYRNVGARAGLRVRLVGPPANPRAIGAVIRLKARDRLGPAREVHAGSGYWSQDGAVQVLAVPEGGVRVWVRWPGGRETHLSVPVEEKEVVIGMPGLP
ncbi:MAG: hypothetical protein FJ387_25595 [Verrucomicrobia bacterium]|nr:hypothetical protein [Verrucomicrobiota bacterium]